MKHYIFPQPCTEGECANEKLADCILKVIEEYKEVLSEYLLIKRGEGSEERLAEELTDVITACTTALHRLGYGRKARIRLQALVNCKNAIRGRLKVKEEPCT